jgi:glycosyltransferase involved in cell wall biosynthesis
MEISLTKQAPIYVAYHQRRPPGSACSIERVFAAVRQALPPDILPQVRICPFASEGVVKRLLNMLAAATLQGSDINHVTGDVHYLALALSGRRTVLTVHDAVGPRCSTGWKRLALALLWYRLPLRRVAAVTVVSEFSRGEVLRYSGASPEKVQVIHDSLPPGFAPYPKPFNSARPTLLQVGTRPNKNLRRVAESLRGLNCHLDIIGAVGESDLRMLETCSISYSAHDGLTDEEVVQRYRKCDMVVFASTYEGFGMPIIEGNAVGRPVLTSNICSMPEVAGAAACLVNPFDCSAIRRGVLRIIQDRAYREGLIAAGFRNAQRFRAEHIAAQYAKLYRAVWRACAGGNESGAAGEAQEAATARAGVAAAPAAHD